MNSYVTTQPTHITIRQTKIIKNNNNKLCIRVVAGGNEVRTPAGAKNFSLLLIVHTGSVTHQASCSVGIGVISQGLKRPGPDVDHVPPSSAKVKNEKSYNSTPSTCLHDVDK
jgi:hypothetical protein